MYLIEKQYLPILQYCTFDETFSQQYIEDDGLYYEFNDCSANETLRNELIKNTRWLAEKGDFYEQHEYLKQQCQIRIFFAFRYQKVKNAKSLKITIDAESNIWIYKQWLYESKKLNFNMIIYQKEHKEKVIYTKYNEI